MVLTYCYSLFSCMKVEGMFEFLILFVLVCGHLSLRPGMQDLTRLVRRVGNVRGNPACFVVVVGQSSQDQASQVLSSAHLYLYLMS